MLQPVNLKMGERVKNIATDEYGYIRAVTRIEGAPYTFQVEYDAQTPGEPKSLFSYNYIEDNELFIPVFDKPRDFKCTVPAAQAALIREQQPPMQAHASFFPGDRNEFPMWDGLFAYFPAALAEVARVSKLGNDQHNPGQPLNHARWKSTDHANKAIRHLAEHHVNPLDTDGGFHLAKAMWRIGALLQEHLETLGRPVAPAARFQDAE